MGKGLRRTVAVLMVLCMAVGLSVFGIHTASHAEAERFTHSYRLSEKIRHERNGQMINRADLTDRDETTYPFTFKAYDTVGSDWGMPGTQRLPKTLLSEGDREGVVGFLYATGVWTGITPTGGIASISAGDNDPAGLVYVFNVPYSGEVRISDMYVEYNWWGYANGVTVAAGDPNHEERPYHSVYGNYYNAAFTGYRWRIEVNGRKVYPADAEWDATSFTKTYTQPTPVGDDTLPADAAFEAGDLQQGRQYAPTVEGIFVEKGDEVEIVLSSLQTPHESMNLESPFDFVASIDPTATLRDYRYTYSTLDRFTVERTPTALDTLSYWYYETSGGLYGGAVRKPMTEIDYANGVFCSSLFGTSATVGCNSLNPVAGVDAALTYRAPVDGNLVVTAENLYRGKALALYRYFDDYYSSSADTLAACDGVRIRIELNNARIWPTDASWRTYKPTGDNRGTFDWESVVIGVHSGDTVTVRVNAGGNDTYDQLNFTPLFELSPTHDVMQNSAVTVRDGQDDADKTLNPLVIVLPVVGGVLAIGGAVTGVLLYKKKKGRKREA